MTSKHAQSPKAALGHVVEALLVPHGSSDEGLAIGVDSEGKRMVGWGSWLGLSAGSERTLSIPHANCVACALSIPAAALATLTALPHERAEVLATGILGGLARHYLNPATEVATAPDLIVMGEDDPPNWQTSLKQLPNEGTAVALLGPNLVAGEFDFYPQIHARSLTLVPLAWYLPPLHPIGNFDDWHEAAAKVSAALLASPGTSTGWTWLNAPGPHDTNPPSTGD